MRQKNHFPYYFFSYKKQLFFEFSLFFDEEYRLAPDPQSLFDRDSHGIHRYG